MLSSPRYVDGRFRNLVPTSLDAQPGPARKRGFGEMMKTTGEFFFGGEKNRRPPAALPIESPLEAWQRAAPDSGLRATWLGHSTVLLEIDGVRVLTDPVVWSERISPVPFVGPRRFHDAPVLLEELPPLDAVLVSHDHYDHLDFPSVRALAALQPGVPFITSLGVGARLEPLGVKTIVELDWWETANVRGLEFTATPARHFSGRSLFDRNKTLWSSWSLETDKHRVFFSGDTGISDDFAVIADKKGPFDLVMLEVGAFHEAWGDIHLGPANALKAFEMLRGKTFLPVHWGTFDLALHAWDDPAETLVRTAGTTHLVTPRIGRAIEPSHVESIDPWWRGVALPRPAVQEPALGR